MAPRGQVPGLLASNIIEGSRKRGRTDDESGAASCGGTASSPLTSTASSSQPPASHQRGSTTNDPEEVTRLGYKLLNVIYHARDVADEEDPAALLVDPFLVLPDEELYADYYQIIKRPLTFEMIRQRLDERAYGSFEAAKHDCEVICQNAKRYNQRDTPIWLKARTLHGIIKDAFAELVVAPRTKSIALESKIQMLEEGPEGVEPITSNPPSPLKAQDKGGSAPSPAASSVQPSSSPLVDPAVNGRSVLQATLSAPNRPTRITLKRKVGSSGIDLQAQQQSQQQLPQASVSDDAFNDDDDDADGDVGDDVDGDAGGEDGAVSLGPDEKRKRPGGRGRKLKSQMKAWVNELWELRRSDGTHHSEFFEELPSRQDYPDYYKIITIPISLKEITSKVKTREYPSPFSFVADVRTMIANAKWYNEQESLVWQDADALQKHLEGVIIPVMLSEGFTLDPNDTRASVLPPYMQSETSASPQRNLTPMAPRVKIKLATRSSANLTPQQQQRPDSAGPNDNVPAMKTEAQANQVSPLAPTFSPRRVTAGPSHSPPFHPSSPQQTLAGESDSFVRMHTPVNPPQQTAQQTSPLNDPAFSLRNLSASGRPVRSASAKALPGRSQGSPQTISGSPSNSQMRPPTGTAATSVYQPQSTLQAHPPVSRPGQSLLPPQSTPSTPGRTGFFAAPSSVQQGPSIQGPPRGYPARSSLSSTYTTQQQQPQRSPFPPGGLVPYRVPTRSTGPLPLSAYLSPIIAGVTREPAIPAFLVTDSDEKSGSPTRVGFRKVLTIGGVRGIRQFGMTVSSDCRECKVIFKVRDFVTTSKAGQRFQKSHAMEVDASPASVKYDSSNVPSADASTKSASTSTERAYRPMVAAALNGCAVPISWADATINNASASVAAPADGEGHSLGLRPVAALKDRDDAAPVALPKLLDSPFRLPATLTLALQRGPNVLEVTLEPPPPCPALHALAVGASVNGVSHASLPENFVEQAAGENGDAAERQREREMQQSKAIQALNLPESYRIYITR